MQIYYRKSNPLNTEFIGNIHRVKIRRSSHLQQQSNTITVFKNTRATETSRNITACVIERDTSGDMYYFLEDSRGFSELANMVAKVAKWVAKNGANLALPPRFRQVLSESPL
ncbi:hypothetical protein TNCV_2204921 [Trichonephila clavipes]|nr:hypothetical protein TNCV_2204921 [Trichonephila clavipes]